MDSTKVREMNHPRGEMNHAQTAAWRELRRRRPEVRQLSAMARLMLRQICGDDRGRDDGGGGNRLSGRVGGIGSVVVAGYEARRAGNPHKGQRRSISFAIENVSYYDGSINGFTPSLLVRHTLIHV